MRPFRHIDAFYLKVLGIFISSRIVVLLAILFASRFVTQSPGAGFWEAMPGWPRFLLRYDSGWYLRIARFGYSFDGDGSFEQPVVFFPLYPLVSRMLMLVLRVDHAVAVLIVSNGAILGAILLLGKLIKDEFGEDIALFAIASLSLFPTSFFFSAGYTESLALLLIVAFFLCLKHDRFYLAALCAGFAVATRSTGMVLLLPLGWELFRKFGKQPRWLVTHIFATFLIATSGLWLYMLYLWQSFGEPLAFLTAQRAWTHQQGVGSHLFQVLTLQPFKSLLKVWRVGPMPDALDPWVFLLFLLLIIIFRKRIPTSYALFAVGVLLLPYLTLSGSLGFRSFTRYVLLSFPVFIILGQLFSRRNSFGLAALTISAAMLFMYMAMFAQWYWVG